MRRSIIPCALALGVLIASAGSAQTIGGRITDRTAGISLAGVVVSGLDANGITLARSVSDSASGYRIPIMPGMLRLQFRRIGYTPATLALSDSANGRLDVVLSRLPTQLPAVKAVAAVQCDKTANTDDALALWDQARSGMLTSVVARESKAAYTSVLVYQTGFEGDDELPRAVERVEFAGASTAFVAGNEPEALARDGYLLREGLGYVFVGPDDQVLFDQSFLASHCFTMEPAASDSMVGVHFETAKGSKGVGVAGTVWLRRDPLDLLSVEYRYTNLDRTLQRAKPGGAILFRKMPNGITMVHQWRIRGTTAITLARNGPAGRNAVIVGRGGSRGSPITRQSAGRDPVATATETGAMIEMMQWPDVATYVAPMATVSGVAIDKYTQRPLANTVVRFDRTPFRTVTDSTGAFTLIDVLPGIYSADVGDPELPKYGVEGPLLGPLAIKYGVNSGLRLEGEGTAATIVRGCGEKSDSRLMMPKAIGGPNAIFGRIVTGKQGADGLSFRAEVSLPGMTAGSAPFLLKGKTDRVGLFQICNLPPGGKVKIVTDERKALTGMAEVPLDPAVPYALTTIKLEAPKPPSP